MHRWTIKLCSSLVVAEGALKRPRCVEIMRVTIWMIVIAVGLTSHPSSAFQVTLLDTTKTESLEWITYSQQQDDNGRRGWREASYTNSQGDVYRVYTVCSVAATSVNNWLRAPYVARGAANRLYVELRFTTRKCTKYPEPGRLQQCKESFKLLAYEAEADFANAMMPTWDEDVYKHVDVIAANKVTTHINDAPINTETRSVAVTRQGVYLAFFDQGACTTLISVRVYHIMCPSEVVNLARFPNTTTGPNMTSIVQTEGVCVEHAGVEQPPSFLCKGDGHWYFPTGRCRCDAGYQPDELEKHCTGCPAHTFKWEKGSVPCRACPPHSDTLSAGSTECPCAEGHYRAPSDDRGTACTRPPSAPRDLLVDSFDQSSVKLSWRPPTDLGGRPDVRYRIECRDCNEEASYFPHQADFNSTEAIISNLNPSFEYKIRVFAENDVSAISGAESVAEVHVTTDLAKPSKVTNVRVISIGARHVTLAWELPRAPHIVVEDYELTYGVEGSNKNESIVLTAHRNFTFLNLEQQTRYLFRVRARAEGNRNWGLYSDVISATTGLISHQAAESPVGIIAGSAVAVVLCMLIVVFMVVIVLRRNHRACNEKNSSDCDALHYSNVVQCPHLLEGSHLVPGQGGGGDRTYVDPYTYEDPSQAVREFTKEIDASAITIESVIGGGEFGDVCKGRLTLPPAPAGGRSLAVAIKTLKAGASDKNRLDFLTEASIMGQFDDPNVIYLEGVVTRSHPIMIVTEFMENGSLDIFLRNNDGKFAILQLVGMLRGIASGMRYLSDMGYVHRDLAARNILVSETLICKVADFGLSREMENDSTDGEYTTKGGKIPVRWTAPEAIAYRKFTSASDVWSYGVVTWEVISYGERPYWNWSNQDVIKAVDRDFKLPPPMDCPEALYQLTLHCWQKDRGLRPKFCEIVKTLERLIRDPEDLRQIALPGPNPLLYLSQPDLTVLDSVEQWLTSIKMERYTERFLSAGHASMDTVARMTLKDLVALGITLVGHQKKILNSIQALHARIQGAQTSDGYFV